MHSFTHHAIEDIDTERGGCGAPTRQPRRRLPHARVSRGSAVGPEPEPEAEPGAEPAGDGGAAAVGALALEEGNSTDGTPNANTPLGDRFGTCGQKNA